MESPPDTFWQTCPSSGQVTLAPMPSLLTQLWEAMEEGLCILDESGEIQRANPEFCKILGFTAEEVTGRPFEDLVPRPARVGFHRSLRHAIHQGKRGTLEDAVVICKDGSRIRLKIHHVPLHQADRNFCALVVRDVTEEQKIHARLFQEDRMRALGTLAGGVAHEFNNLLVSILGYAELIEKQLPYEPAAIPEFARRIHRAARRGGQLTEQLLPFAEKSTGELQSLDIGQLVLEVAGLFRLSLGERFKVQASVPATPCWIRGERAQLQQVFINLFLNASDAMPDGGTISVLLQRREPTPQDPPRPAPPLDMVAEIQVQDTGKGMEVEVLHQVFDPFFTTDESGERVGLGLALVYGVVRNLGGRVTMASSRGQGSTVTVTLPCKANMPPEYPL